jgi:hypothetical protein
LLEPQRTNAQIRSEEFDNSHYTKTRCTITANNTTSPDGTQGADKLVGDGTGTSYVYGTVASTSGTEYALSVFVKKINVSQFKIQVFPSEGVANFDIENGANISISGAFTSQKIENYGNGWYRCSVQYVAASTATKLIGYGVQTYNGDQFYLWGAQNEVGNTISSYIPTSSAAVTRVQDYIAKGGNEYVFNNSEGVLYAEIQALANDQTYRFISISDNSASSNRVVISYNTTSNQIRCDLIVGGLTQSAFSTNSYDITQKNKVAIKYKLNDVKMFANGLQVGLTDTSANVFPSGTLNQINFDNGNLGSTFYFEGFLNDLQYFDEALSDAELATLTTL